MGIPPCMDDRYKKTPSLIKSETEAICFRGTTLLGAKAPACVRRLRADIRPLLLTGVIPALARPLVGEFRLTFLPALHHPAVL